MKARKCIKTGLSVLLALAMLFTSVPGSLTMTVQASEIAGDEQQLTEATTADQDTLGGGTERLAEEALKGEEVTEGDYKVLDNGEGEDPTGAKVEGKQVTFYCKPSESFFQDISDVSEINTIEVRGDITDNGWNEAIITLTKDKTTTGVWESAPMDISSGPWKYKFVANSGTTAAWETGGDRTFVVPGLGNTSIPVKVNGTTDLPTELNTYYETGSSSPTSKAVVYESSSLPDGITLENEGDQYTITVADSVSSGETFKLTAKVKDEQTDTAEVTVNVVDYLPDPNRQSPVVEKGQATFSYYAPKSDTMTIVKVKGSWNWDTATAMDYEDETGYWSITLKLAPNTYEYGFLVGAGETWTPDPLNSQKATNGNNTVTITEAGDDVSPIIEGRNVKFIYENKTASRVSVAGTMEGCGWSTDIEGWMMTKNEESGYWELLKEIAPGYYQYKFIADDNGWTPDPWNPYDQVDTNSVFTVEGLEDAKAEVERIGTEATLPSQLNVWTRKEDGKGEATPVDVTYALSEETKKAAYAGAIQLEGKTISLTEDFPEEVESFTLTASNEENTSTVTVYVVDKKYKYTIYYYDEDNRVGDDASVKDAALWIWTDGIDGTLYNFTKVEELNGNKWLKAEVELSYTDLSIIPRNALPADSWTWQDSTRNYSNTEEADEVTLYIIFDDGNNIYTELPQNVKIPKRYLVVEYEREDTITDWEFYTWNSGYGDVYAEFKESSDNKNGIATVRVRSGLESISFCLEKKSGDSHWADQDGGDYRVSVPADQNVVKIKIKQGEGITYTYPYNIGYELSPLEKKIYFYYRDDEAFKNGSDQSPSSVTLEYGKVKGEGELTDKAAQAMNWNSDKQRYEYVLDLSEGGMDESVTYYYRYQLEDSDYVTDSFNKADTEMIGEDEYSVCTYKKFDLEVSAEMQNASMDYNENNVLTVSFQVKDTEEDEAEEESIEVEVSKATVDLTEVGGNAAAEIDPELLQISIAVKEGIATGEKTLPVVVFDQYNNKYEAEAKVNVTSRVKSSDFDWDEAVIYFAVTDRFFDGNTGNNGSKDKGYDVGEYGSSSYHGGDFAGLTQKLDYLNDLGVNTIWITPIVENQSEPNADDKVGASWGYHGYWAKDFEKLDSHLGTEAEFKALLDAAHARGMKIMVDVVLNHSGYGDEIKNYFNNNFKDEEGNPIRMIREDEEIVNGHDQKTSLSGLPDFLTENKEVRELLVEWQSNWISKYDIDYYRVDTVKHVDDTTWSAFKNALTAIDPDFKMIGEWAGAGYATDTGMLRTGRMDSLLDFDFNNQATDFVNGKIEAVENFMTARNASIDNTATLGAFLGSHDEDGFVYALINESKIPEATAKNLGLVAASLQLTAKGQVVIYYGEEIGMTGANNYPYQTNRYDFDWSQANSSNATLAHYKTMLAIRDRYSEVLAKGTRKTIEANDANGLDVFERELNGTTLTVALNIKDKAQTVTVKTSLPAGTVLYDYYATYRSGNRIQYVVGTDGNVEITVPAAADGGTVVLTAGTPVGSGDVESGELQEGFDVAYIANKSYTGKNITLSEDELKVYYNGQLLTIKKDYTASYKNNKTPGTATITIKGKGNYAGAVTTTFDIVAKNVNDDDIVIDYKDLVATGKAQKPLSKITNNGIKLGAKDYTVKYYLRYVNGSRAGSALTGVTATGTYEMVIEGTGNYTGTRTEIVHVIDGTYMNKTKVTLQYNGAAIPKAGIAYTGSPITKDTGLSIEVTKGNDPVAADCYEVAYSNNTEVGTATVTLTGVYNKGYVGSVSKTFKIAGKNLSSVAAVDTSKFKDSVEFDFLAGEVVQIDSSEAESSTGLLKLKDGVTDDKFTKDSYTVSYTKNDKPGKATAVFTGQHGFTGTIKKTFTIKAIDFSETNKKIEGDVTTGYTIEASAPYRKAGAKAAVTVQYKGKALEENKDYTLKYSKNGSVTDGSTAEVKVSGKGAFTGNYTLNFKVDQVDLTKLGEYGIELTAPDVVFVNKNGKYKSVPVLDGLKISGKAAKEYTLTYYAKEVGSADYTAIKDPYTASAGTDIKVEVTPVTGKNSAKNYTGTGTAYYRVANASIAKAKVSVKAQEYTGKEIVLGKSDFSSVKVGKDTLVWGKDYEIVPGSYTNNINKGNASVTIRGIGNYTGEKKVTFKITSRFVTWWWNLFK